MFRTKWDYRMPEIMHIGSTSDYVESKSSPVFWPTVYINP